MVQHDWKKASTKANRAERPGGIVEDLTELEEGVSKVLICYPQYEDERQRNSNTREGRVYDRCG
jgi:hypothetical protein